MPLIEDPDNPGTYFPGAPSDDYDEDAIGSGLYLFGATETTGISFSWGGVDFTEGGPYYLQAIEGWSSPPDGSADDLRVTAGHGSLLTPMVRRSRVVTVEGVCVTRSARDQLFEFLGDSMAVAFGDGSGTSPLAGWVAGRILTAEAQLQRFAATTGQARWSRGVFGFILQWRCPDPLRYGPWESATSPLAVAGTGLALPTTLPAAFPANPIGGSLSVTNTGNAGAPAVFTLLGPLTDPGVLVNAGTVWQRSMVWTGLSLGSSDTLTVDTSKGAGFLNGVYRAPSFGSALARQCELRPGSNSVQALGSASSGAVLTVTFRPAYW